MALIYLYDASDLDKQQLTERLSTTDHRWEFVSDHVSIHNVNPETEVLSVFVSSQVTAQIIEALPKLQLIACRSTGFNNIDLEAASARGITVVNVPTYGERTVAEYAFALLLSISRKIPQAAVSVHNTPALMGFDLIGKKLLVIGTGHIGQHVIRIARGFDMEVLAYDAFPNQDLATELGFRYLALDDALAEADIVTLHAPYLPTTHHLLSKQRFQLMKKGMVLINTARGELIDTKALTEALADGTVAAAGLDVVEGEKLLGLDDEIALLRSDTPDPAALRHSAELLALKNMSNVIITPHNAFNTESAIRRINATTALNITRFWYGEIPNRVTMPKATSGRLILVRHAESEWNASGRWSGQRDVHLSQKGFHEAALLGLEIADLSISMAYCSEQIRTLETLEGMLAAAQKFDVPIERSGAINERDYGDYTGKNKWDMKKLVGEEAFNGMRRGWDYPIPNGETLRQVYERVEPFYKNHILKQLQSGKNVLIVAHGNSLRALIKYIENIGDDAVSDLEMLFGSVVMYRVDEDGHSIHKELRHINSIPPNA